MEDLLCWSCGDRDGDEREKERKRKEEGGVRKMKR